MNNEVPFELPGFEPISRIGGGGFGEVWLARQSNIDRKVAVKVGHAPIDDQTVQLRFERECIALGRLSGHPNIIDVFTAGQMDDGRPYLVLEFVNGGTLWQRFQRGPLSEPELCRIGSQLCNAIDVAHEAGVLHRDLKPENVLLRQNGEAVLGDFGIARLHDGANTTSHAITASVAYAAPEILSGKSASTASDLYGIGVCLLAAVLRSVPFVQKTDESIHPIINRVLSDAPPDLRQHGVSEGLSNTIGALLEKSPDKRPATAAEAKAMIDLAANPPPPVPSTAPGAEQSRTQVSTGAMPAPIAPLTPPPSGAVQGQVAKPAVRLEPTGPAGSGQSWLQSQPAPPAKRTPTAPGGKRPSSGANVAIVAAAIGAALLLGVLLLFGVSRIVGTDNSTSSTAGLGAPATGVGTESTAEAPASTTSAQVPFSLPLALEDLRLGAGTVTLPDTEGPDSSQFCDNTPVTVGLADWEGVSYQEAAGYPLVFQQLARFDTANQASAYVSSFMATVDCTEWTIPGNGQNPDLSIRPNVVENPPFLYGDDTREIAFRGDADIVTIVARASLMRQGANVYLLTITSVTGADLDELDRLLRLAASRLGF